MRFVRVADPQVELVHALVTADPLHNKAEPVRVILDKGGGYLIGTKANTAQPAIDTLSRTVASPPAHALGLILKARPVL